jgi:hypothetical protein
LKLYTIYSPPNHPDGTVHKTKSEAEAAEGPSIIAERDRRKENTMRRQILAVTALGVVVAIGSAACEKGPMQKAGEKIDRATDQDKAIGKGPLEKAGKNVDDAAKDLKK